MRTLRIHQHLSLTGTESKVVICVIDPGSRHIESETKALKIFEPLDDLVSLMDTKHEAKLKSIPEGGRYVWLEDGLAPDVLFSRYAAIIEEILASKSSGLLGIVSPGLEVPPELLERIKVICLDWPDLGFIWDKIRAGFKDKITTQEIEWFYPSLAKFTPVDFIELVDRCHGDHREFLKKISRLPPPPSRLPPMALQIWETWIADWQLGDFVMPREQKFDLLVKSLCSELQLGLTWHPEKPSDFYTALVFGQEDKIDYQVDVLSQALNGGHQGLLIRLDFRVLPRRRWFEFTAKIRNIKPAVVLIKGVKDEAVAVALCQLLKHQTLVQAFIFEGGTKDDFANWQIPKIQIQ